MKNSLLQLHLDGLALHPSSLNLILRMRFLRSSPLPGVYGGSRTPLENVFTALSTNVSWSIYHIRHTSNEVADVLARLCAKGSTFIEFV